MIIVSASIQCNGFLGFSDLVLTLGQDLGPVGTGDWDLDLTILEPNNFVKA